MADPEISVVIPVRNGLPWIVDQLEALCGQDFEGSWELLVSDNGSSDGTQEVVRSFAGRLPLQIIDSHGQPGIGPARNAGARAASGPMLAFCDADDVVAPGWLNAIANGLRDADAVGGHLEEERLNAPGVVTWRPPATPGALPIPFGLMPAPFSCNCGMRSGVFKSLGGFDEAWGVGAAEETDLYWRAQLAGHTLKYVPEAVVHYRHRHGLPALMKQYQTYGFSSARLVQRYAAWLPRESGRDEAKTVAWVFIHIVDLLGATVRRNSYLRTVAHLVGQWRGCRQFGTRHYAMNRTGPAIPLALGGPTSHDSVTSQIPDDLPGNLDRAT